MTNPNRTADGPRPQRVDLRQTPVTSLGRLILVAAADGDRPRSGSRGRSPSQLLVFLCFIAIRLVAEQGPLTPEQALRDFQVDPGLVVELVAAEPVVGDPVALAFDERGRMFVAENRGY